MEEFDIDPRFGAHEKSRLLGMFRFNTGSKVAN